MKKIIFVMLVSFQYLYVQAQCDLWVQTPRKSYVKACESGGFSPSQIQNSDISACGSTIYRTFSIYTRLESPAPAPVYPNPVSDILNIETGQIANSTKQTIISGKQFNIDPVYDVRLYDGQGNLLRQQKTKGGTVQFNVSNLPDSQYYLHIYDDAGSKPVMETIVVEH